MRHIEAHYLESARDAAMLATAGLPRYDLEPVKCGSCSARCGEVFNPNGESVAWKPFAVVLNGETIATVCGRCFRYVDKSLANR